MEVRFGKYRLHSSQGLWRGSKELRVTPKSLAVLSLLVERRGEVVTKAELFSLVWADTAVSDSALTSCIKELRRALQDTARHSRFIETLHRRGYRFIAAVDEREARPPVSITAKGGETVVGRAAALDTLSASLAQTTAGRRQVIFVLGDPGIGKTAVLSAFLATISSSARELRVAFGQCIEHYGAQEPYQPLLDAIARLCRQSGGDDFVQQLRRFAPSWLVQLPGLTSVTELRSLQRRTLGTTPERMRRELIDVLEAISGSGPLVLCLEDLHWADLYTLDWIAAVAARTDPAALLFIGTARPAEIRNEGRLRALSEGLRAKGFCKEIILRELSEYDVRTYVGVAFPASASAQSAIDSLARSVFRRTEGHPLFLVNLLNELLARGVLVSEGTHRRTQGDIDAAIAGIPDDIRRTIARQLARLEPLERSLLEVSSVLAEPYSAAAVAAGADVPLSDAETRLVSMAREHWFVRERPVVEWPDGTVSATFEFLHALYRDVLSEHLPPARRVELHRRVGERLERGFGHHTADIAAELATHFATARDMSRAVRYSQAAAEISRNRNAHLIAEAQLRNALSLLDHIAPTERVEREIEIRIALAGVLMALRGWSDPEAQTHYERAIHLCRGDTSSPHLFVALWGLWVFHWGRGPLEAAEQIAARLGDLATPSSDSSVLLQASHAQWATSFSMGRFSESLAHATRGEMLYDVERHAAMASTFGSHDAGVCSLNFGAQALALTGRLNEAVCRSDRAVALARRLGHPFSLALALCFAAMVHESRRDAQRARQAAAEAGAISRDHSFRLMHAWAGTLEGWSFVDSDPAIGTPMIENALATLRSLRGAQFVTHLAGLLAYAQSTCGRIDPARKTIAEALELVEKTGERYYHAELIRLDGELLLASAGESARHQAESAFREAIELARRQDAKIIELRAATSLARIVGRDDPGGARSRLVTALGGISEGSESLADVKRAADLLNGLSGAVN